MPTPRTPTSILIARGSFRKNPQRAKARENEPVVTEEIGEPPACFMPEEKAGRQDEAGNWVEHPSVFDPSDRKALRALWYEFVADDVAGVLNRNHRSVLEEACRLKLKTRNGTAKTGDRSNYINCLRQLGMTPAAQSTVTGNSVAPAGRSSPIGRLAQQARRAG